MSDQHLAFVVAGVAHSGAEALFDALCASPAVCAPRQRTLHFFDDETRDWARPDYGGYHAQFEAPAGRLMGEVSTDYLYWPQALERIAAYSPKIKLIVTLRDPARRAWAHWRSARQIGAEAAAFAWCIRAGRQRLFAATPWGFHRTYSYVERGFYGEQVARLTGLFPREQVLFVPTGDPPLMSNEMLEPVWAFLDVAPNTVEPPPDNAPAPSEEAYDLTPEDVAHLRQVYARDQDRLAVLTGLRFG